MDRQLLDKIDFDRGVVEVEGKEYELNDRNFPTIDRENPYLLYKGRGRCNGKIREIFL